MGKENNNNNNLDIRPIFFFFGHSGRMELAHTHPPKNMEGEQKKKFGIVTRVDGHSNRIFLRAIRSYIFVEHTEFGVKKNKKKKLFVCK